VSLALVNGIGVTPQSLTSSGPALAHVLSTELLYLGQAAPHGVYTAVGSGARLSFKFTSGLAMPVGSTLAMVLSGAVLGTLATPITSVCGTTTFTAEDVTKRRAANTAVTLATATLTAASTCTVTIATGVMTPATARLANLATRNVFAFLLVFFLFPCSLSLSHAVQTQCAADPNVPRACPLSTGRWPPP